MIRPMQMSDVRQQFKVLDIENYPTGDVLTIDICWRRSDQIKLHKLFTGWEQFWKWLRKKARQDKSFRVIYAHNGGGWDWLSFAHWLLTTKNNGSQYLSGIIAGSKLVTMSIQVEKKFTIHLCDSFQLLRSSLKDLSDKFGVTRKIDLGGKLPHEIFESDRNLFDRYVEADTESLLEVMEKSNTLLNEHVASIGEFGYTIGSTAMKVFKTMLSKPISIPSDPDVKEFLRSGYRGGRVEVFKVGYFPKITVYDVNSLYPYAMLTTNIPISNKGVWTEQFDPDLPGCYQIDFEQIDKSIPAVLMIAGVGAYKGSGVYYTPEIALLRKVDPLSRVVIKKGYVFLEYEKIFQDYVNKLYALRQTDKDGPISLLAKYLLNSLYGKFAQNPVRKTIISAKTWQEVCNALRPNARCVPINEELGVWSMEAEHATAFEHVGIAGMITSSARCILYNGILDAGSNNVVYCDTDSVHTIGSLRADFVGAKIGQFKNEFEGEAVYVGKKLYALCRVATDGRRITKLRAKGVSIGGRNGSDIRFDDFRRMAEGAKIKAEFSQPCTPREVFGGSAPCRFQKRTRTIGRTD